MTPEELDQELADLDRLAPPSVDPAALLRLESRIAELEAEKAELTRTVVEQRTDIVRQTDALESRKRELLALESDYERKRKEWESRSAEWDRREAFWALNAQQERVDRRAKWVEKTRWISLGLGTAALGLGFIWAAERYWTFTQNEQLQMMEAAAKDKAAAVTLLQQARQEFDKAAHLNRRPRRTTGTANRTTDAGGNSTPRENGMQATGENERQRN